MLLREVLEKAAALFLVFRDVLFKCRYRHSAHVAYCEDSGNLDPQGEPFAVAVKFPREKESGLQCRVHEIMLFDRNENGLEAHGDLQFVRAISAQMGRHRRRLAVSRTTTRRATGTPVYHANSRASSIVSSPIIGRANRPFVAPLRSQGVEKPATAALLRADLRTGGRATPSRRRGTPTHRDGRSGCPS